MMHKVVIPSSNISRFDMMQKQKHDNHNISNISNACSAAIAAVTTSPFRIRIYPRNRLGHISALLLFLLIISSASFWSPFLTTITESQKLDGGGSAGDGQTSSAIPLSLSHLLPSALAKSYERNTVDNRLDLRDGQAYGENEPSNPLNETPIVKGQSEEVGDIIGSAAINPGELVHIMWQDFITGNNDIFYKRAGADFDPSTVNLSSNPASATSPKVAVSGDSVHVVWTDSTPGNPDIFYKRSTDRGGTFGAIINLSDNAGDSMESAIAVSGNNVHVVWQDNTTDPVGDIFYRRSTDGGATFTELIKNLSNNVGSSLTPSIAVLGNSVHVAWEDNTPGNPDILYRRSTNGGSTFPNIITNLSDSALGSFSPAIAAEGDNVHVVWTDTTPAPTGDILYRRSTDGGASFTEPIKNLSSNAGSSAAPAIAAIGNNVHVVWQDSTPPPMDRDILYRKSTNGGSTFPNIITNVSDNSGDSQLPAIAAIGVNIYVVWRDNTGLVAGDFDIFYRPSTDSGVTFDPTVTNVSANAGASAVIAVPSIAVSAA
jgi:hypothetical protein